MAIDLEINKNSIFTVKPENELTTLSFTYNLISDGNDDPYNWYLSSGKIKYMVNQQTIVNDIYISTTSPSYGGGSTWVYVQKYDISAELVDLEVTKKENLSVTQTISPKTIFIPVPNSSDNLSFIIGIVIISVLVALVVAWIGIWLYTKNKR